MNLKKRNRWYGLLLSFVLLFSLGGCGDVQTETPQPSIETSVTDTTQESSDAEAIISSLASALITRPVTPGKMQVLSQKITRPTG